MTTATDQSAPGDDAAVPVAGGWVASAQILDDAQRQAQPEGPIAKAQEQAWLARARYAAAGMSRLDPDGFEAWACDQAASDQPRALDAQMVAAWETFVRAAHTEPTGWQRDPWADHAEPDDSEEDGI